MKSIQTKIIIEYISAIICVAEVRRHAVTNRNETFTIISSKYDKMKKRYDTRYRSFI